MATGGLGDGDGVVEDAVAVEVRVEAVRRQRQRTDRAACIATNSLCEHAQSAVRYA